MRDCNDGMRRNAQDYQTHDKDQDGKLDFDEFCSLVRDLGMDYAPLSLAPEQRGKAERRRCSAR